MTNGDIGCPRRQAPNTQNRLWTDVNPAGSRRVTELKIFFGSNLRLAYRMRFDQTGSMNLLSLAPHYEDDCGANEF